MKRPPHVTISGELGSGKSSVARHLADVYSVRWVSTGDIQRSMAKSLNLSTLETNWLAERDNLIDAQVDQVTKDLGAATEPIVFDSRMAWHIVPNSYKVHLLVDPKVAAKRLHLARSSPTEQYDSARHARDLAEERYRSEQRRFLATYGVDVFSLRSYDLVIDTSAASVDQVLDTVRRHLERNEAAIAPPPCLYLCPRRIIPDHPTWSEDRASGSPSIRVGYSRPIFCSIGGHAGVLEAVARDDALVKGELVAEGDEPIDDIGHTARQYVEQLAHAPWVDFWHEEYGLRCSSALR